MLLALKKSLDHAGAQNLIEAGGIIKAIAQGRISTSHILPADPFVRVGNLQFDFVRPAPDEALTAEQFRAIMTEYRGRPANRHDFEKLLEAEGARIIKMAAEHRLNFVLLGERGRVGATVTGNYARKTILCFGWQEIGSDGITDPKPDFYQEDSNASWDSSYLALYVY